MASCFKNVSNRLFYLKASGLTCLENMTNTSKFNQKIITKKEKFDCILSSNCISMTSTVYDNSLLLKNTPIPLPANSLIPQTTMFSDQNKFNFKQQPPILREKSEELLFWNKKPDPTPDNFGRPSEEQLEKVFKVLSEDLPRLFVRVMNYNIYHEKIVLENNIKGKRTVGIGQYIIQLALFKALAHFRYAYVKFIILKITKHPEEGTIKVRWQIQAIDGFSVMFKFWEFKLTTFKEKVRTAPTWYDGFSIYHVGSDGLIYKHVIDKMMPDDDKVGVIEDKSNIPKLTMYSGLNMKKEHAMGMDVLNDSSRNLFAQNLFVGKNR